jgi:hypothetical protein
MLYERSVRTGFYLFSYPGHWVGGASLIALGPARISVLEDILGYFVLLQHHSDINDIGFGYRIFRDFAANEWIYRPDINIRIFYDFAANEWIHLTDIRIF